MHLIFSGEEPWLKHNGKNTTIMSHMYFSKNEIPYIKLNNFPISKKVKNVEMRIFLRMCLEHNQLKRTSFLQIEKYLYNYLTKQLVQDTNFEFFLKHNQRKGKKIYKKF